MRVQGEAYFFMNAWMDFLCLALTAVLGRRRLRPGRAALAAFLGAGYAVLSWAALPLLGGVPALLFMGLILTCAGFGRRCLRLWPMLMASGWLLYGLADFAARQGAPPLLILFLSGAGVGLCALLCRRLPAKGQERLEVRIRLRGREARLPAFRDSGNLLCEPISGLPVIVAPLEKLRTLMPPGVQVNDLSTLPPGWRFVRARTAVGSRMMMCFHPDGMSVRGKNRVWPADGWVAPAELEEERALLPEAFFVEQKEGRYHAGL